jgi:hypothetical protein
MSVEDKDTERRGNDRSIVQLEMHTEQIMKDVTELKAFFHLYVTLNEFVPVKLLAYGFAGLLMTSVVGAMIAMVVHRV